ncbi:MAG TPA: 16S rRNA (cytidine(1402)-2'-O)-methyltransferase [Actinomycetota bacterium]|nr:16S rRNA (cytidine(1402)-2'-O)-methyltransferase [Actinomycetota bacterium]
MRPTMPPQLGPAWDHRDVAGTLYLVGTPIGNLGDMTDRARETLRRVDLVAAEDTRRTGRLFAGLGIRAKTVSLFEGNERARTEDLLVALRRGDDVAVVSDAGMPAVSDPGFRIVRACVAEGIDVRVVPGPSAAIAALVVSGLPSDRWAFEGFLPRRAGERVERLRALRDEERTVVVFESPRRLTALLRDVLAELGDRRVAVARELTKVHEEVVRGRVTEVLAALGDRELKGEVVVVLEGAAPAEPPAIEDLVADAQALVRTGMRKRAAAGEVARRHGVPANEVYEALVRAGRPTIQS